MQSSTSPEPRGLFPRMWARLFGSEAARLKERLQPSHWLSYVLIWAQSAAVLLVFGHAEIQLLLSAQQLPVTIIAAMGLFVLLASVFAADMAMLATIKRVSSLARNRQRWALREHLGFIIFVLTTEAITLGVVLSVLDAHPDQLVSSAPLIAPDSEVFHLQIVLRVVLVAWTAVQLVIVRANLPVLLSTLTATGRELVGAHVERKLASMDIEGISLPAGFRVYASMSKPPRRVRTMWNGWLVRRELLAEAEEQRQVDAVVDALDDLEARSHPALPAPMLPAPTRPPTGPGRPTTTRRTQGSRRRNARKPFVLQLPPADDTEERIRAVWDAAAPRADGKPRLSNAALAKAAGISTATASKWTNVLKREDALAAQTQRLAQ